MLRDTQPRQTVELDPRPFSLTAAEKDRLTMLFSFTSAEVAIVQGITAGLSDKEIAKATGKALSTVRTQFEAAAIKARVEGRVRLAVVVALAVSEIRHEMRARTIQT